MLSYFANPHRFMGLSKPLLPVFAVLGGVMLVTGWVWALAFVPDEQNQGASAQIMFVHVPAAMISMMAYGTMALGSFLYLILRHTLADVAAKSAAPVAAGLTFICLVTGSLWGRPTWGAYWVWDARLTSMLFQLFLIFGYMALRAAFTREAEAARASAILCLVGAINLPIIKFSVDWWNSIHQQSSLLNPKSAAKKLCDAIDIDGATSVCLQAIREKSLSACHAISDLNGVKTCQEAVIKSAGLAPEYFWPLIFNIAGMVFVFSALLIAAMRADILNRQYEAGLARLNRSGA